MSNLKFRICKMIATFFYVGLCPVAPGTAGSLVAAGVIYFLPTHLVAFDVAAVIVLLIIGVTTSAHIENTLQIKDPSWIVIDEVLGMFLTACWLPKDLKLYVIAFVLFRFFDITKFFPIKRVEQIAAPGWGVMLDDVVAAIYSVLAMYTILYVI